MPLLILALLIPVALSCLPGGIGSNCGCSQCPCGTSSPSLNYGAHYQPSYAAPIPGPNLAAPSSYQGHYASPVLQQDLGNRSPSGSRLVNPDYYGRAPLSFPGETPQYPPVPSSNHISSFTTAPTQEVAVYAEQMTLSHTSLPASDDVTPKNPFLSNTNDSLQNAPRIQQIEVSPSQATSSEDSYGASPPSRHHSGVNGTKTYTTYYNQVCTGEWMAKAEKETILSATKKCAVLGCVAANALPDSFGTYTVNFLSTGTGRINRKGYYCLSSKRQLMKSRKVIKRFEELDATEKTERVRRLLWRRRQMARS
ncbi:unnamed protein product [Caenorhabditis auriculariae]|uniref:Uncharacterized protein n=1 Tax=Caenorhabditis auriculariae TaxID=2777116 RepID=A0A8S1GN56_9PELO|nr:unnamed protein product [Caenorhabditis auriculariae]